jgi:hypothetical protein
MLTLKIFWRGILLRRTQSFLDVHERQLVRDAWHQGVTSIVSRDIQCRKVYTILMIHKSVSAPWHKSSVVGSETRVLISQSLTISDYTMALLSLVFALGGRV